MRDFRHRSLRNVCILATFMFIFLPKPKPLLAGEAVENMDMAALQVRVERLQQRLDRGPDDYEALLGLGITYHSMAIKDSKVYTKKAVEFLEQAHQRRPDDWTALCYLGSGYTLLAKDSWNPVGRLLDLNKGFQYMDKAVRKDPENITLRLVRANNSKAMPRFFNRRSLAYEDFEYVISMFERDSTPPAKLMTKLCRTLAAMYEDDGNTVEAERYRVLARRYGEEGRLGSR